MAETPNDSAATVVTTTDETVQQQQQQHQHHQQRFSFDFSPATNNHTNNWHTHRQSHNPSKLPAFRFADLRKESLGLPSLLTQAHGIPPSPVSPGTDLNQVPPPPLLAQAQPQQASQTAEETLLDTTRDNSPLAAHNNNNKTPVSPEPSPSAIVHQHQEQGASPKTRPAQSRASTFLIPLKTTAASATRPANPKRSVSLDVSTALSKTADTQSPSDSASTIVPAPSQQRRAPPSYSETPSRLHSNRSSVGSQNATTEEDVTKEWAKGQRELLLPKTLQRTDTDGRRNSTARRPPVSYRPSKTSPSSAGSTARIPPIRSFRSSGDRHSLGIDTYLKSPSIQDDDLGEPNHHDRSLRALEGRRDDDCSPGMTPPGSATDRLDADDSGDVFLKMAREEPEPPLAAVSDQYIPHFPRWETSPLRCAKDIWCPALGLGLTLFPRRMSVW